MDVPHPRDWWDRVIGGHRLLGWSDLCRVDRAVLGGLVVEYAERARSATYEEPSWRDAAVLRAIGEAIAAAARGRKPASPQPVLPAWVARVVRKQLKEPGHFTRGHFVPIRLLELAGLVELDVDADYVLSMMGGLVAHWSWGAFEHRDPVNWFRQDPELIERALWKLFEVEGGGETSLTDLDRHPRSAQDDRTWQGAFLTMIGAGMLSRDRVLDACLAALSRDFTAYHARWFAALLKELSPSTDEIAARHPVVRRLLDSEVPATVTLAVRWLKTLDRAARLDDEATAPRLARPAVSKVKSTARTAVALLENIRRRTPGADVITGARAALGHPDAEVQRRAAALLRAAGDKGTLLAEADQLEPSVRHEFGLMSATSAETEVALGPTGPDIAELQRVTEGNLLERLAAAMERPGDALEIELVLDRLAQCTDPQVLAPLVKRARALLKSGHGDYGSNDWLGGQLSRLVVLTTGIAVPRHAPRMATARFLFDRLVEIEQVLTGRAAPAPLLATPDSPAGWVTPETLVRRLATSDMGARRSDLLAAILRLGPEGRAEALVNLSAPGEVGVALRHAFGDSGAKSADVQDTDLWVAASRARRPLDADPVLLEAKLNGAGQGRGLACSIRFADHLDRHFGEKLWTLDLTVADASVTRGRSRLAGLRPAQQPTASRDRKVSWDTVSLAGAWHGWTSTIWPHDAEHFLVESIDPVFWSAWAKGSLPDFAAVIDALGRHPGRMGPLTACTLALGLAANQIEDRVRAVDALVAVLADGRLTAEQIGDAMAGAAGPCVATRWADSLRRAAAAGAGPAVIRILTRLGPQLTRDHQGLYALLDVLHQESLRAGRRLTDPALRAHLDTVTGSGKAARTARSLLAL